MLTQGAPAAFHDLHFLQFLTSVPYILFMPEIARAPGGQDFIEGDVDV
jgi:hypothetical protein